ncbi:MAG: alcohol dehydrogenase catalytic domain-containing protein [Blastocatellia bacterium]|nr:alcohol dehydrogenase catalytic domain-containing protein [Blastocatellia bacterium]
MKALRFENQQLQLSDIATPNRDGEALVRVTTAGVCNTDLEIVRGYANFSGTLGHEFVGIVEVSPEASQIGCRVVGEINAGCGNCALCQAGDPRHCANRTVLGIVGRDGAFADYLSLPAVNLLKVPDEVSDRQAVFTEPLAAACEILDQVTITSQHRVAVIGDGKLGQLIARVLATTKCELVLIGKHAEKLQLAASAGITTTLLNEVDATRPFDFVVEASGAAAGLQLALQLVRPRGTIILKSTFSGAVTLDTSRIVVDEISVIGSRCGRFDKALALLATGQINVEPLIAAEYSLTDGVAAMQHAARAGTLKVLLKNTS